MPEDLRAWLLYDKSLTRRIQSLCGGVFEVVPQSQRWAYPLAEEARALRLAVCRQYVWVREVYLTCNGRPWVFARTLVPRRTLSGAQRRLARLRSRPLGSLLFSGGKVSRLSLEVACLHPHDPLFRAARLNRAPTQLWARRSLFSLAGKPILVIEVFLPEISADFAARVRVC
jgi:chorismate--pyruvate lyase